MSFADQFGTGSAPPSPSQQRASVGPSASSQQSDTSPPPAGNSSGGSPRSPSPSSHPWDALQTGSRADGQSSRKRSAEELEHIAKQASKRERISAENTNYLVKFAKLPQEEQFVDVMAKLIKFGELQAELHPPDAAYRIPNSILENIEDLVLQKILNPSATSYMDKDTGIVKVVMDALHLPSVPESMKKKQISAIDKRIRDRNNDRRSEIKAILSTSMWEPVAVGKTVKESDRTPVQTQLNIFQVCEAMVALHESARVKIDITLLARVAFLRHCLTRNSGTRYWDHVDKELKGLRDAHAHLASSESGREISNAFYRCLKNDCTTYGLFNLSQYEQESRTSTFTSF